MKHELYQTPSNLVIERGIAPFEKGIPESRETNKYSFIKSSPIPVGSLGEISMELMKPKTEEELFVSTLETEKAFSFLRSGEIFIGYLRDLLNKGYYQTGVVIEHPLEETLIEERGEKLNAHLWNLHGNQVITSPLESVDKDRAVFFLQNPNNTLIELVLPNDPKVLKDVRINVSNN
ncbi:MAG: hypothetical protein ACD_50C00098G0002 [uncultured bacterium]|nr:MAG: hypothetical protein ACD_50C00098G0002 [uncultured bacterium]OGH14086.1 MAG: hypothetical protein A2687_02365 [Candidatus Levybacteria bacterium RIFCSPHIGHO2_01_FULL_38_26]